MFRFACSSCHATLQAPPGRTGFQFNCPRCGQRLQVPAAPESADADQPKPAPAPVESTAARFRAEPPAPGPKRKAPEPEAEPEESPVVKTKSTKKKKRSRKVSMWVAVAGGMFLFGCCACSGLGGVGYWVYTAFQPDSIQPALKWIPDNSQLVMYARVHELGKTQFVKDLLAKAPDNDKDRFTKEMERHVGFTMKDVSYAVVATRDITPQAQAQGPPDLTVVVRLNKNITAADILASITNKFTDTKIGSYTMYTDNTSPMCFAVVDKRTIVFGESKSLRAVLERNGPAQLATSFKETLGDLEYNHHMGGVCNLKSLRLLQDGGARDFGGGLGADSGRLFQKFEKAVVNEVETCMFTCDLNDPLKATFAVRYPSTDAAAKSKSVIDDLISEAKRNGTFKEDDLKKIKGEFQVQAKGRYVKVNFQCGRAEVTDEINKNAPGGNLFNPIVGGGGRPGPGAGGPGAMGHLEWNVAAGGKQEFKVMLQGNQQMFLTTGSTDFQAQFAVSVYDAKNKLVIKANSDNGGMCHLQFRTTMTQDYKLVIENRDAVQRGGWLDYSGMK